MLRVAEQYAVTDTGRQRRANEDSLLARSPLFVVADGMGGAQAGEVASQIAVDSFQQGLEDGSQAEAELAELARAANARIHELSHSNAEQAGMGTTLTAVYVGEDEVAIAHVGDSRAYCLRDGELLRLTDDHSLVDELLRQGRLTPEEAVEHPQRSVITRALGPEGTVEVDTRSYRARPGDVYLLCSDGLTTMLAEAQIQELLLANPPLRDAGEALIAAANEAGGRDNITVVLIRLEEVHAGAGHENEDATMVGVPAVSPPVSPRAPRRAPGAPQADASTRALRR
ncbi:MAG: protein serine/threonine phosphatase, partial [Solirubrobacterales bacterium]|nr:protein serine/threonine phosphatase [Solirubrobacterales bacterium]